MPRTRWGVFVLTACISFFSVWLLERLVRSQAPASCLILIAVMGFAIPSWLLKDSGVRCIVLNSCAVTLGWCLCGFVMEGIAALLQRVWPVALLSGATLWLAAFIAHFIFGWFFRRLSLLISQ